MRGLFILCLFCAMASAVFYKTRRDPLTCKDTKATLDKQYEGLMNQQEPNTLFAVGQYWIIWSIYKAKCDVWHPIVRRWNTHWGIL